MEWKFHSRSCAYANIFKKCTLCRSTQMQQSLKTAFLEPLQTSAIFAISPHIWWRTVSIGKITTNRLQQWSLEATTMSKTA